MSTFEFDESTSQLGGSTAKVETASLPEAHVQERSPAGAHSASKASAGGAPRGQIYTVMAREGINAAEVVNTALKKKEVGKETPRRVEVIAPHGPSTSGGKKARQSITLVPVSGQGAALMCGFLDVAQKTVEIRDYALVAEQFKKRFGARFDVSVEEYVNLTKQVGNILETLGFKISAEAPESGPTAPASAQQQLRAEAEENDEFVLTGSERAKLAWLVGGALLLVALLVLVFR